MNLHSPDAEARPLTDDEERLRVSVHEAGHAVAALHYGHRVVRVDRIAYGTTLGHMRYVEPANRTAEARRQNAVIAAAGMVAVLNAGFGVWHATRGTQGDSEYLESIGYSLDDPALWHAALAVLRARWDDLEHLAVRIYQAGTVYGPELRPEAVAV